MGFHVSKEIPSDNRVRSSGMRSIDYHRYQIKLDQRRIVKLTHILSLPDARRRSYMQTEGFNYRPLGRGTAAMIGKKFKLRTSAKPPQTPWVEHVKDGRPLTAHGAALLGVPWEGQ